MAGRSGVSARGDGGNMIDYLTTIKKIIDEEDTERFTDVFPFVVCSMIGDLAEDDDENLLYISKSLSLLKLGIWFLKPKINKDTERAFLWCLAKNKSEIDRNFFSGWVKKYKNARKYGSCKKFGKLGKYNVFFIFSDNNSEVNFELNGELIGTISVRAAHVGSDEETNIVQAVWVNAKYRGKGLMSKFLHWCVDHEEKICRELNKSHEGDGSNILIPIHENYSDDKFIEWWKKHYPERSRFEKTEPLSRIMKHLTEENERWVAEWFSRTVEELEERVAV